MKVLVACEESQEVCKAFREKGHDAYSCDIQKCSGAHPEWHILDCIEHVMQTTYFITQDNKVHNNPVKVNGQQWDLILAFPPCTYLTNTGNRWFNIDKYGEKASQRWIMRKAAVDFFLYFTQLPCDKIAIENPIGCMATLYRKPNQIIHPYMFGDPARKSTCLWLKGLPSLIPTNVVEPEIIKYKNGKGTDDPWHMNTMSLPPLERAKARSKTFPGIAKAMAEQWG